MKCEQCGYKMLKRKTGRIRPVKPPQYQYQWWCGEHGWQGEKFFENSSHPDDIAKMRWRVLNRKV